MRRSYVIGIDEVGRGPLAGPVVVCAVMIDSKLRIRNCGLGKLKDSKQLTAGQRERWAKYLRRRPDVKFALARISPARIDRLNISRAANLAAWRAYERLVGRLPSVRYRTKLDGGLFLKNREMSRFLEARTIVKGDEKVPAIAAASIIAKVARDQYMVKLARQYPGYGFEVHKGYGTLAHRRAIKRLGPSPVHRRTFLV
ncbi:MAG TPA: ribonuclease HII [Candidatus Paceibacterota bacterium]|nr:ribonuclease HII [Candidatus Paceibacterota bacterium]